MRTRQKQERPREQGVAFLRRSVARLQHLRYEIRQRLIADRDKDQEEDRKNERPRDKVDVLYVAPNEYGKKRGSDDERQK
jgi:hypothetical protein